MLTTDKFGTFLQLLHDEDVSLVTTVASNIDIHFSNFALSGFMWLSVSLAADDADFNDLDISIVPLMRDATGLTWLVPLGAAAHLLDETLTPHTSWVAGGIGYSYDLAKYFQDNGDYKDFFGGEGVRIILLSTGNAAPATVRVRITAR